MDLLFARYASPFLMLQEMMDVSRFDEFITELISIKNEETETKTLWEMYLHHMFLDKTFEEFKNHLGIGTGAKMPAKEVNFETTIKDSVSILNGFVPEE